MTRRRTPQPDDEQLPLSFDVDLGSSGDAVPVVLSYGMGVESTAILLRWLCEPASRPHQLLLGLSNLVVLIAQTGDEWPDTIRDVETHILPLLREHRVRLVEVARAGPRCRDGLVVLQDSRTPQRLHADAAEHGFFALSTENRVSGTLPQLGGSRKCSVDCTKSGLIKDGLSIRD